MAAMLWGYRTSEQEGGAVRSKLAPEGREKVQELEHADVVLPDQPVVLAGGHPEQDRHHDEAQLLRGDDGVKADVRVVKSSQFDQGRIRGKSEGVSSTSLCMIAYPYPSAHALMDTVEYQESSTQLFLLRQACGRSQEPPDDGANLDAVAAPVDVVNEPRGEIIADQGNAGVEQRPRQGGGDAAACGARGHAQAPSAPLTHGSRPCCEIRRTGSKLRAERVCECDDATDAACICGGLHSHRTSL